MRSLAMCLLRRYRQAVSQAGRNKNENRSPLNFCGQPLGYCRQSRRILLVSLGQWTKRGDDDDSRVALS